MRVDESVYNLITRASQLTKEEYDIYWRDAENIDGYIEPYELINIIKDLICEIDHKEEEIEDIKQDIESNYVPVSISSQVDISDRDFIEDII